MPNNHNHRMFTFSDQRLFQTEPLHSFEGCIEILANVLVGRVWELVYQPHNSWVSSQLL